MGLVYAVDDTNDSNQHLQYQLVGGAPVDVYPSTGAGARVDYPRVVAFGDAMGIAFYGCDADCNQAPLMFIRSGDQGRTWEAPVRVNTPSTTVAPEDTDIGFVANEARSEFAMVWEAGRQIHFAKSTTGAKWTTPVRLDSRAGSSEMPTIAVDPSNGRYYAAWEDNHLHTAQLMLASSDDGKTWTAPVAIPAGPATENHYEVRLAVDWSGTLHAAWLWNIPLRTEVDLYHAASRDGGKTWTAPQRVNDQPSTVSPMCPWTYNLHVADDGTASVVWSDWRGTDEAIFFAHAPAN
jgi:hypothetical protein